MKPLEGLLVVDFSTLLPGPLASLMLTDAGARVVKIERPGRGDEMRSYEPKLGDDSINFAMLNRGKQSIELDLKAPDAILRLRPLLDRADILIEQFRPGVMDRLGLGYGAVRRMNPRIIYCSITGYGQSGPKADLAGHDLNYLAETGVLSLSADAQGAPTLPPLLAADIAGGSYPAMINILLALIQRDKTGRGSHLDIAMTDNLFPLLYWALGQGHGSGKWPIPGKELVTGGSPRYQIYRTRDDRFVAAAPLEDKFWDNFCELIELPQALRGTQVSSELVTEEVAARIAAKSSDEWRALFALKDTCCSIVATLDEAVVDPHFSQRRVFSRALSVDGVEIPALPTPISQAFQAGREVESSPRLGETRDPLLAI